MAWLRLNLAEIEHGNELLLNVEHIVGVRPNNFDGRASLALLNGVVMEVTQDFDTVVAMITSAGSTVN